jgi:hypothetical protein
VKGRGEISKRQRFRVLSRDEFRCVYCGTPASATQLHVDHIFPVCEGGGSGDANLATACSECNLGKSGLKLPDKTLQSLVGRSSKPANDTGLLPDHLSRPVYNVGSQWCVTSYGLERIDGGYVADRHFVFSISCGYHTILHHLGEKTWVDMKDLFLSLRFACEVFSGQRPSVAPLRSFLAKYRIQETPAVIETARATSTLASSPPVATTFVWMDPTTIPTRAETLDERLEQVGIVRRRS